MANVHTIVPIDGRRQIEAVAGSDVKHVPVDVQQRAAPPTAAPSSMQSRRTERAALLLLVHTGSLVSFAASTNDPFARRATACRQSRGWCGSRVMLAVYAAM